VISGAREFIRMKKEDLVIMALNDIHRVFPNSRNIKLVHSVIIKEKNATFSATPFAESVRPNPETPVHGLFLAGDWTATGYPATIEGAVISGFRAAELVPNI
jgi:zeta-carotene desaturase